MPIKGRERQICDKTKKSTASVIVIEISFIFHTSVLQIWYLILIFFILDTGKQILWQTVKT